MFEEISQEVQQNCNLRIFVDNDDFDECAYFIPEVNAIGINAQLDNDERVVSVIHEVAHYVDINEFGHERRPIDEEVIAHAVEEIVFWNAPLQGVISEVEDEIRESYLFNDAISVDEEDISEVADRVRIICNYF